MLQGANLVAVILGGSAASPFVVEKLSMGCKHACVVSTTGNSKCWGANDNGQLGQGHTNEAGVTTGTMGDNLNVIDWGSSLTVKEIAAGGGHTCALLSNGAVKCVGLNSKGALGYEGVSETGIDGNTIGDNLDQINVGGASSICPGTT